MTHHRTRSLIAFLTLFLALALAAPVLAQEATPTVPPSQPEQPATGPGSDDAPFPAARMQHYGEEPQGFWLWEPLADPDAATPVAAGPFPVILYLSGCCGAGEYPTPEEVEAWISHLARQGYVVIAPVYKVDTVLDDIAPILQQALDELARPGHAAIDLEQFAVVAYSYGGVPALHYASSAEAVGLPVPDALFLTAPCIGPGFCVEPPDSPAYPEGMKAVVLAYDRDEAVGTQAPKDVYAALQPVPAEDRDFVTMQTDETGDPAIVGTHQVPYNQVDAADWYALWKLSAALLACTFTGDLCDYALGNSPEQRFMGEWSDGTPVKELVVADDATLNATPVASPVAIDPAAVAGVAMPYGDPARTGQTEHSGIQGMPVKDWEAEAGDLVFAPPVASEGVIFLPTISSIEAIDRHTGEPLWQVSRSSAGSGVSLDDGVLYAGTFGEGVWALDAATGQELFRIEPEEADAASDPPPNTIDSTPLVVDGTLYFNGGPWGRIYAFDIATQEEIWRFETDSGAGAELSYADGVIYQPVDRLFDPARAQGAPPAPSGMVAVAAATGQELWHFDAPEGFTTFATPVVIDGTVLFGVARPEGGKGIYFGLDAKTGAEKWRIPMRAMWRTSSAAGNGMFYLTGAFTGGVYGVDAQTGEIMWEHETGGAVVHGLLLAGDLLYVSSDDGMLAALDPATGGELWSFETISTFRAGTPTLFGIYGDSVYVAGHNQVMAITGDGSESPGEFTGLDYPPAPQIEGDPSTYATFTGVLETPEPLLQVQGIAVAPDGTIYAVDSANNRIAVFNADGSFREFWGSPGSGDGQFTFHDPQQGWHLGDIDVAEDGTVYVLDPGNMRIQTFDPSGAFLASLGPAPGDPGNMNFPGGLALDEVNDRLFVASLEDTAVHVYDLEGNYLESWGPGGAGDTERFMDPTDVAVGSEGSVYVAEHGRSKIRVYTPEGQPVATWGGWGSDPGRLIGPWGIAVDAEDNLLVADYVGDTIVTYAPDGKVIGVSGGAADADDYLGWPAFVAAGPNGTIYVAEEGGSEISVYAVGGAPAVAASPEASPVASPEA